MATSQAELSGGGAGGKVRGETLFSYRPWETMGSLRPGSKGTLRSENGGAGGEPAKETERHVLRRQEGGHRLTTYRTGKNTREEPKCPFTGDWVNNVTLL